MAFARTYNRLAKLPSYIVRNEILELHYSSEVLTYGVDVLALSPYAMDWVSPPTLNFSPKPGFEPGLLNFNKRALTFYIQHSIGKKCISFVFFAYTKRPYNMESP